MQNSRIKKTKLTDEEDEYLFYYKKFLHESAKLP